jgi:hypothetical protein
MEYDLYSNQGDKEDNMRMFTTYMRAMMVAMLQDGLALAAGIVPLTKGLPAPIPEGLPTLDDMMPLILPGVAVFTDVFTEFKMAVDPNNIANRRWEYETGLCKKLHLA